MRLEGAEQDYINANYVRHLNFEGGSRTSFIACQAPLPTTMGEFWWMVWQERSCLIVMLTRFREKGSLKAQPYWPKDASEVLDFGGPLEVALLTQKCLPGVTISTLRLAWKKDCELPAGLPNEPDGRVVYHLHYTEWPDFGVPRSTRGIRSLVSYTNLYLELGAKQGSNGPIICHCSAGIGRTGAFIAVHIGISLLEAGLSVDVAKIVMEMRHCRCGMVQTDAQYYFVYEALNDHIHQYAEAKKPPLRNTSASSMSLIVPKNPKEEARKRSISHSKIRDEDIIALHSKKTSVEDLSAIEEEPEKK